MSRTGKGKLLESLYSDPKYAGKYIIVVGNKVYSRRSGEKHTQLLEKLLTTHPQETPVITYIPKEDTLILVL